MKKKILIYSGNTYNFEEYLLGIIKKLLDSSSKVEITLIQNSFFIESSKNLYKILYELNKNKNFNYKIYKIYNFKKNLAQHYYYTKILENIFIKRFDLLITGTDSYLFDKYLLFYSKKKKLKTILIHSNTLDRYLLKKNIKLFGKLNITNKFNLNYKKKKNILKLFSIFPNLINKILIKINILVEFKILPKIFFNTIFKLNYFDNYIIPSGHTDCVILLDQIDYIVTKNLINNKNIFYVNHPIKYIRNFKIEKNTILIALNNYTKKDFNEDVNKWIININSLLKKHKIKKIKIKFHPRTNMKLKWIRHFLSLLPQNKEVKIFNNNKHSFFETFNSEIIMAPCTGALRSVANMFGEKSIYCLLNSAGYEDGGDYEFFLGYNPKISFLDSKNFTYNIKKIKKIKKTNLIKIINKL